MSFPRVLLPGALSLMLRRLTHTQRVRWPRRVLYAGGGIALLSVLTAATVAVYANPPTNTLTISLYRPVVVMILPVVAGLAVIVMEGSRDRSGEVQRALECLPVRRRDAALLVRLPSLILAGIVIAAPLPLATAALMSVGGAVAASMVTVLAAEGVGLVCVALPYWIAAHAMRSARWDAIRFPVVLVLWVLVLGWQYWLVFDTLIARQGVPPAWAPLARTLVESLGQGLTPGAGLIGGALGLAAALAIGVRFASADQSEPERFIRWEWRAGRKRGRFRGELRYALRDPAVCANATVGLLTSFLVVVGFQALPPDVQPTLQGLALTLVGVFAATAARGVRGIYPARVPPQRLLGLSAASWAASTAAVVLTLAGVVFFPVLAVIALSSDGITTAMLAAGAYLLCGAFAIVTGAVAPVSSTNVLGQGAASGVTVVGILATSAVFDAAFADHIAMRTLVSLLLALVAVGVAGAAELIRWRAPRAARGRQTRVRS